MRFVLALLSAASFLAPSSAAQAGLFTRNLTPEELAFSNCDGYGAPNSKADGITTSTWMFGLASTTADLRRGTTKLGPAGVTACDQALASPRLLPAYVLRRSHLLQARAVHEIAQGNFAEALANLDQSDRIGPGEPLFDQSIGQGNRALRATALSGLGKRSEAAAVLTEMEKRRPYAISELQLAMHVRLQFEDDLKTQMRILEQQAPLNPVAQHELFWLAIRYDDFPAALRYAAGVSYDDPRRHGNWKVAGADIEKYLDVVERAKFAGAVSYAQNATGNRAAAAKTAADMRVYIDRSMQPPPAPAPGAQWSRSQRADYEQRTLFGNQALELFKVWQSNIALRDAAKSKTVSELPDLIKAMQVQKVPALGDIILQAKVPEPKDTAAQRMVLDTIAETKDKERLKELHMSFQDLVKQLPRPETASMQPRWQTEGIGIMRSDLNGYAVRKNEGSDSFTVRFGAATGTLAMVDEGALLAAAYHARREGKDAFVIDAREPIQRTIQFTGLYSGGRTENSGYEVQLVVRPMNTAAAGDGDRERLIRADQVIAALAPKFGAAAQ